MPDATVLAIRVRHDGDNDHWHYACDDPPVGVAVGADGCIYVQENYKVSRQGPLQIELRLEDPARAGSFLPFAGLAIGADGSSLEKMRKLYANAEGRGQGNVTWPPETTHYALIGSADSQRLLIEDVHPGDQKIYGYALAVWHGEERRWTLDPRILNKGTFPWWWPLWCFWLRLWRRGR